MNIIARLQKEFNLRNAQVENTIKLIDSGNTIPFIARYRKELTGSLDDQVLREFFDRLNYLRNLEEKKEQTKNLIDEQGSLTETIIKNIQDAETIAQIDDIYRPFRPKRRTRATIAKEKGLESLASLIFEQKLNKNIEEYAKFYLNSEKEVYTIQDALDGAKDIISEIISENSSYRNLIRKIIFLKGYITSKNTKEESSVYEMYYEYEESVNKIASHRILALNRGEKEGILSVKIEEPLEEILQKIENKISLNNKFTDKIIKETIEDSYKRLIFPSIEREVRNDLTEKAEEGAIKVFGENLAKLLMQAPLKDKIILAIDPAFRTGCKIAIIDETGKVIETGVIYPTKPHEKIEEAAEILKLKIAKHDVDIIAIGNGTASRETELFISNLLKQIKKNIHYVIVDEAGASVYSASKLGAAEFPEFDVSLRSAISIGRRLQDPLAELVKLDPKIIGVGQYQHDMNQKRLSEVLFGVVENCVNRVGVDLNTASASLLYYVAGISESVAKNIIKFREEYGKFTNRKQLLKVSKLGPKTFEQCAGFLRISDGDHFLDNTGVHPESYDTAKKFLEKLDISLDELKKSNYLKQKEYDLKELASELNVSLITLQDIVRELEKPGRSILVDMTKPILKKDILHIEDLKIGMILKGTIRNVTDFGAFVDIGVHSYGLVHISELAHRFIKHPLDAVSVGQIVEVKVINLDIPKNRIFLSMKV